jgi:hypothetical protein
MSENTSLVESFSKDCGVTLSAAFTVITETFTTNISSVLGTDSTGITESFVKNFGDILSDATAITEIFTVLVFTQLNLADATAITEIITKAISSVLLDNTSLTETLTKAISNTLNNDSTAVSEVFARVASFNLSPTDTTALVESILKLVDRPLTTDIATSSESIVITPGKSITDNSGNAEYLFAYWQGYVDPTYFTNDYVGSAYGIITGQVYVGSGYFLEDFVF